MRRRAWLGFWIKVSLLGLVAIVSAQAPKTIEEISGKVIAVTDGDTLTLLRADKSKLKVRLEGIDAPEAKQQHGEKAKDALAAIVLQKEVTVKKTGDDRYGRTLGVVMADGRDINLWMVESGWAWHFKRYSKDERLAAAELRAREARIGLWAGENIIAPWEYRARQKAPVAGEVLADQRHWLNTSSNVRHNSRCQSFNNTTKGRFCGADEGKACGICGG